MIKVTLEAQTREQLQEQIDRYFRSYHPAGYGTDVESIREENGVWKATVSRNRSCD